MLQIIPARDSERARQVAASALAFLALLAFALIMATPHRPDLAPAPLRAQRILAFRSNVNACRDALASAQLATAPAPDVIGPGACGYRGAVEVATPIYPYSQTVASSCALAAGLMLWERDVVGKAALQHLHTNVVEIEVAGAPFQCRQIAGRKDHRMSEHAYANAIDIGGFRLADGRRISVAASWRRGSPEEKAFLRDVRGGACRYFQAVLSPDYNRAHANHLHFDLGRDKICR